MTRHGMASGRLRNNGMQSKNFHSYIASKLYYYYYYDLIVVHIHIDVDVDAVKCSGREWNGKYSCVFFFFFFFLQRDLLLWECDVLCMCMCM